MREIMRTTNPVLISFVEDILSEAGIIYMVADQNISVIEGSIGIFPRRILVDDDQVSNARSLLEAADLGEDLISHKV